MNAAAPMLVGEADAAAMLGISARTLRSIRKRGDIDFVLIGSRILYSIADLSRFVEGNRQCASIAAPIRPIGGSRPPSGVVDFAAVRAQRTNGKRAT